MHKLKSGDAQRGFGDALNRVAYGHERILVLRRGKPVAAIVTLEDLKHLEAAETVAEPSPRQTP
jgi:prevent-host-death family protein